MILALFYANNKRYLFISQWYRTYISNIIIFYYGEKTINQLTFLILNRYIQKSFDKRNERKYLIKNSIA